MNVTGFKDSKFPIKYLGVPIIASSLTKVECTGLVEKIMARMKIWATRHISFAGRAKLINSVLFGMFNYWASIFILPQAVLDKITHTCRNFLWSGTEDYKKVPLPHITAKNMPYKETRRIGDKGL